ncbi:MAG: substrate binding domain-containing protein [Pseudomonadota bacterium]
MSLTEAGSVYLARIDTVLEELDRARTEAQAAGRAPRSSLRLTASMTFGQRCVLPALPASRARYPELSLDCLFTDAMLDLVAERIDLAIRLGPAIEGDVVAAKLMPTRYRVVASPAHLAGAQGLTEPADLAHHRCLLFSLRAYQTAWRFRRADGAEITVPVAGDIVLSPASSLRQAALAGLGPALLPDWLIDEDIAQGRLVDVFPDHAATATSFETAAFVVYPSRSILPQKVRAMIDHLRAHLALRP